MGLKILVLVGNETAQPVRETVIAFWAATVQVLEATVHPYT